METESRMITFQEITERAVRSERTVLLLRHSMRESLKNGTSDPPLTPEGLEYARECGGRLAGLPGNTGFGASPRKRTVQTAESLRQGIAAVGGGKEIRLFPEISDTAMFEKPEELEMVLREYDIPALLRQYYSTGKVAGLKELESFADGLARFLTKTDFGCRNMILVTHDILIAALLTARKVRTITLDDWCGYLEGAALFRARDGVWTLGYAVPDLRTRKKASLFI